MKKDLLSNNVTSKLIGRGVFPEDIAYITYQGQKDMIKGLKIDDCIKAVESVLNKREVQHILLVGLNLDILAEQHKLDPTLNTIVYQDEGLFGVDEDLATCLCHLFGSIAETNYGYLDVKKHGIINKIDKDKLHVNTFLDDLIGAIAASAMAYIAHNFDEDYDRRIVKD